MAHEGAAPGTPGAAHGPVGANPPGYNPPPPSPVDGGMDFERFAERFPGYAYILQLQDPAVAGSEDSLISIVNQWIADYVDTESDLWTNTTSDTDRLKVLLGQMEQSTWYETFDVDARAALVMEITDSATWNQTIERNKEEILQAATAMGIRPLVNDRLDELARTSMLENWSQAELEQELAQAMYAPDLQPTVGSVKALYNGLLGFTNSQLTSMDQADLWEMAWGIKRGENTLDNAYQTINQSASNDWSLTDFDLNAEYQQNGTTMANRLRGVQGTIAQLWDLSPADLNMMDLGPSKLIVEQDGKRRLMNTQEAALMARQDDRFLDSSTYKDEVGRIGSGLMRMMS
jgi:hypothetical protein